MTGHLAPSVLVLAACLVTVAALAAPPVDVTAPVKLEDVPRLTVRGDAELRRPADQMRLRIGVLTENTEATAALRENSRRMEGVVAALTKTGLGAGEYETGRFSIRPVYTRRPRTAGPEWRPTIAGYEVTNSLAVRTKKLDLAGALIEAANEAGANSIDAISFDLADPRTHRAEAIATATANARSDAATLARAADLRLVRVISIHLDEAGWRPPVPTLERGAVVAEAVAAPPPIEPGEVTVRASVTIVYEIEPGEG